MQLLINFFIFTNLVIFLLVFGKEYPLTNYEIFGCSSEVAENSLYETDVYYDYDIKNVVP